jgi:hypothetical protein
MDDLRPRLEKLITKYGTVDALAEASGLERTTIYSLRRGDHRAGRKALAGLRKAGLTIRVSDIADES